MHYEKRRLFIGIHLTPFLRKRLAQMVAPWNTDILIPTREQNFHITLHHLGFVSEDMIPELCEQIETAVEDTESFEVSLSQIEIMDSLNNPKYLWLSGESQEPLRQLYDVLMTGIGTIQPERKTFRPHVTLAKIKKAKWLTQGSEALPKIDACLRLNDPVDAVTLFESTVLDGKKVYDPIATFPLR